jgi:hypothetical protein
MAVISKGIKLYMGDVELENLQEIPELGGTAESIEVTTLASVAHEYTNGILNYGDSLAFKFLYAKEQFATLSAVAEAAEWRVELPDGATCTFSGTCSVALDGVGVNAALTYTLSIKPNSAMVWA